MNKILPVPTGLTIDESPAEIVITCPWYKHSAWFLALFCVFWDGFLIVWYSLPTPVFAKMFALIHLAVGVGITWYTACLFLNKSVITINSMELRIVNIPLFFPGFQNAVIGRGEFSQVYIQEKSRRNKGGSYTHMYELHTIDQNAYSNKLPLSFDEYGQAIFVKRKIEQYMRITPQEVEGEHRP